MTFTPTERVSSHATAAAALSAPTDVKLAAAADDDTIEMLAM